MDPQLYVEFATLLEAMLFDTWVGLCYARDYAAATERPYRYPVPPEIWDNIPGPPWPENNQPPANQFTYFYTRSVPLSSNPSVDMGAVYVLYDDVVRFCVQSEMLPGDIEYFLDIAANAKAFEQLTEAAQIAVTPPPEE
jgi:hypothetical protein